MGTVSQDPAKPEKGQNNRTQAQSVEGGTLPRPTTPAVGWSLPTTSPVRRHRGRKEKVKPRGTFQTGGKSDHRPRRYEQNTFLSAAWANDRAHFPSNLNLHSYLLSIHFFKIEGIPLLTSNFSFFERFDGPPEIGKIGPSDGPTGQRPWCKISDQKTPA